MVGGSSYHTLSSHRISSTCTTQNPTHASCTGNHVKRILPLQFKPECRQIGCICDALKTTTRTSQNSCKISIWALEALHFRQIPSTNWKFLCACFSGECMRKSKLQIVEPVPSRIRGPAHGIYVSLRDPIDHLMSQRCNSKRGNFRVEQTSTWKRISTLCWEGPNGSIFERVDANEKCTTETFWMKRQH